MMQERNVFVVYERKIKLWPQSYRINALRIDAGVPEMGADIGSFSSPASFGSFSFVNPIKVSLQPYLLQFCILSNIIPDINLPSPALKGK